MRSNSQRRHRSLGTIHIFCPIYEPHPGGGGTYFPLLARYMARHANTHVYTEGHPHHAIRETDATLSVWRVFLRRDTLPNKSLLNSACRYGANSLIFFALLLRLLCLQGPATLIFTRNYHAHYLAGLRVLKWLKPSVFMVNDIRTEFPAELVELDLGFFDLSLSNALSTEHQLSRHPNLKGRRHAHLKNMVTLPTPATTRKPALDVQAGQYTLFCGTLSKRKSVDVVVPVMKALHGSHGLLPILIGRPADFSPEWLATQMQGTPFIYREHMPHAELTWLEQHAALVLLPSRLEGLPRVAIETLCFHGHIVLPPCCPEFSDGLDVATLNTDTVLSKSLERLQQEYTSYDVSQHDPEVGLEAYRFLLEQPDDIHRQRVP